LIRFVVRSVRSLLSNAEHVLTQEHGNPAA
jgi:hypothetical protein